ncbi:MAG: serine/threonine-protein phosphatase [Defluviitaleaceae bacterium]|nr:serine/threonine-protein phosphatase [Defluviitaleaceae bacterium]
MHSIKKSIFNLVRDDGRGGIGNKILQYFMIIIIVINLVLLIFNRIGLVYYENNAYRVFEMFTMLYFVFEYIARVWTIDLKDERTKPSAIRISYILSPALLLDFFIIFLFFPLVFITIPFNPVLLRTVRLVIRILITLKIVRYYDNDIDKKILASISEVVVVINDEKQIIYSNLISEQLFKGIGKASSLNDFPLWPTELLKQDFNHQNPLKISNPEFERGYRYYEVMITESQPNERRSNRIYFFRDVTERVIRNEEKEKELAMAKRIQKGMLPKKLPVKILPDALSPQNNFSVYANMIPAKELGGDFYDYFFVDDEKEKLAVVIADVCDKGTPSALFMVKTKIHVKDLLQRNGCDLSRLDEVMADVNNHLCEDNGEKYYATILFGIFDSKAKTFTYVNAGHDSPLIRKNGTFEKLPQEIASSPGLRKNKKYKQCHIDLQKNDIIFLFTDGVTEAQNRLEELYGEDNLINALNNYPDNNPENIFNHIYAELHKFENEAEQFDDITMLILSVN